MISTDNISIQFGSKPLFEDINVTFSDNNKYGLIGANGSGKSTFMKILSGEIEPSTGSVKYDLNQRIAVLKQDHFAFEDVKICDCVMMGHKKLWKIKTERDRIYDLEKMSEEEALKVSDLEIEFSDLDGYMADSNASELLLSLGIAIELHHQEMNVLAPGMKLRVLLAQALFGDPEILLLDEPTNNLDLDTIKWLENILQNSNSTMIIISHDRHFLNSVCTHIADIDYGEIRLYPGNYDNFMIASTQARQRLLDENKKKKDKINELKTFVKRFSANASKAKQATSRANQIDKIKMEDIKKSSRVYPFIRFEQERKLLNIILEVKNLCKNYDKLNILENFNLTLNAEDRLAILGPNGIGKTTLINCLINEIENDGGLIKWSGNANIAYFSQNINDNTNISLLDWMSQWARNDDSLQIIRGLLGRLLFSKDDINKSIQVLSGGEKRRMFFGKIILQRPNVIIMDEPTNHLDMESIEALNNALRLFKGTLIFASHDQEFVTSLATRIIELKSDTVIEHGSSYEDYMQLTV